MEVEGVLSMYNPNEIEAKDRKKVVIFAGATAAVILALIVAIVVVATGKASRENIGGTENGEFSIAESSEETKESDDSKESKNSNSSSSSASKVGTVSTKTTATATAKSATTAASEDLPNTGPENLVPLALAMGALTTAGTALVINKKR
ncbi:LPXTG cell wall anchor domain-containing protein [Candidatus Saccharibacteria bacterium]|nr:LPXTG cell wall anchor domain-containing protein [Candidatus Saccharibacteria bacterium]